MRPVLLALALIAAMPAQAEICLRGVNLSGAEFGDLPGKRDTDYTYPSEATIQRLGKLGASAIRLPFRWERLQPELNGSLDIMELAHLDQTVRRINEAGLIAIIDLHNYGYYAKKQLGSKELPAEALADVWSRLAEHYRDLSLIHI